MKKLMILLLLAAMLLTGCVPAAPQAEATEPPTQAPTAAPTQPPTGPPTEPPTEPTEPPKNPVLDWELPDYPQLSYEEYFSEVRCYYYEGYRDWNPNHYHYFGGWGNEQDSRVVSMKDGKLFVGDDKTDEYVQIGTETYENTKVVCCDEFWVYLVEDHTELFRIDYNGENRQTLHVDETQKLAPIDEIFAWDNSVLFFAAGAGSDYGIYRLYLPDMTLDLLYTTEMKPYLFNPYSNFEITWTSGVKEVVNDVWQIDYYYNSLTGELLEEPITGERSWGGTWNWWHPEPVGAPLITHEECLAYCQKPEGVDTQKVVGENVIDPGGIIHTRDHIYYVPEKDPTQLYRVEYSGENKTLLYESEHGEIGQIYYFGNDPNGVIFVLTGGNRIIAMNLSTGDMKTVLERYEIQNFIYYPDYVSTVSGSYYGPVIEWTGRIKKADESTGRLYCFETRQNLLPSIA